MRESDANVRGTESPNHSLRGIFAADDGGKANEPVCKFEDLLSMGVDRAHDNASARALKPVR